MGQEVRCANPGCGHPSRLGGDALGRAFRCVRCGSVLPRSAGAASQARGLSLGLAARAQADDDAPWEREPAALRGRTLGVALPSRVGRYRIQSQRGEAGATTTYRALDGAPTFADAPSLEVTVVHERRPVDARGRAAFLDRVRSLVTLRHPGIVPILDGGHDGVVPYLVAESIRGRTLAEELATDGRPGPVAAAEIASHLADALAEAHRHGVVHGALSPEAVLRTADRNTLLSGFPAEPPRPDGGWRTEPGRSPVYLAPEHLTDAPAPAGPASDQYALGAILYGLLCGRAPFEGPVARIVDEAIHDGPLLPRDWNPRVPRELERICLRALARDPSDRYPSCAAMAADLRRWLARAGTTTRAVQTVRRAADWARRRPAAAASAALTLAGVIGTTVLASALIASTALPGAALLGPTRDADDPPQLARGRDRS